MCCRFGKGTGVHAAWKAGFEAYKTAFPDLAAQLIRQSEHKLPDGWKDKLPRYKPSDKALATRKFSEIALNAMAPVLPELVGGSADLTPSTLTALAVSVTMSAAIIHYRTSNATIISIPLYLAVHHRFPEVYPCWAVFQVRCP